MVLGGEGGVERRLTVPTDGNGIVRSKNETKSFEGSC